jgi:hypothetical protein
VSYENRKVLLNNFLCALENECKLRDSRVFGLRETTPSQGSNSLHLEVGVRLKGDSVVKLPFMISPETLKERNIAAVVSGILMTVDRYAWGFTGEGGAV